MTVQEMGFPTRWGCHKDGQVEFFLCYSFLNTSSFPNQHIYSFNLTVRSHNLFVLSCFIVNTHISMVRNLLQLYITMWFCKDLSLERWEGSVFICKMSARFNLSSNTLTKILKFSKLFKNKISFKKTVRFTMLKFLLEIQILCDLIWRE